MNRVIELALLVAVLATTGASPARADDRLALSRDGVRWAASLDAPLFEGGFVWVPGDRRSASFYVRNQSGRAATLDVEAVAGVTAASLLRTGDLRISTRGAGRRWTTVSDPGTHTVVRSVQVPSGGSHRVEVVVDFDASSPNRSQRKAADLRFRVQLTGSAVAGQSGSGVLPQTGGVPLATLLAALALLAGGATLLAAGRRRRASG